MKKNLFLLMCSLSSVVLYGQRFAVSADKMNVAYIGPDNPLTVVAEGYSCEQLELSCSNGTITKSANCEYNFRPVHEGKTDITVKARTASGIKQIGVKIFRVKIIPSPQATIMGKSSGMMRTAMFKVQVGVLAKIENFDINSSMRITNFKVAFSREGQLLHSSTTTGPYFDKATRDQMGILKPGDKVSITDIKAVGPDTMLRSLNDIEFTLN
jgi:hypothetical protein